MAESTVVIESKKLEKYIKDNTAFSLQITDLEDKLVDKEEYIKSLTRELTKERETNTVIRDCLIKFASETSLPGLIKACSTYIIHYYRPSILTFYIRNDFVYEGEEIINNKFDHMYDFSIDADLRPTSHENLTDMFYQMSIAHQTTKHFSSFDLQNLREKSVKSAVMSKIQYSNKVIGYVLMEYVHEYNFTNSNLLNLILEVFANSYSSLIIAQVLARDYNEFRSLALNDLKTNIPNSRQLSIDLEKVKDTRYCLVSIDIDNFKTVNDTYGHDSGDIVLEYVGQTLCKYMKELGGNGYREGGDEFFGLSLESLEQTHLTVQNMLNEIWNHEFEDTSGRTFKIGNSVGIYERQEGEKVDVAKKKVDNLLYISKDTGKKKITINQEIKI